MTYDTSSKYLSKLFNISLCRASVLAREHKSVKLACGYMNLSLGLRWQRYGKAAIQIYCYISVYINAVFKNNWVLIHINALAKDRGKWF